MLEIVLPVRDPHPIGSGVLHFRLVVSPEIRDLLLGYVKALHTLSKQYPELEELVFECKMGHWLGVRRSSAVMHLPPVYVREREELYQQEVDRCFLTVSKLGKRSEFQWGCIATNVDVRITTPKLSDEELLGALMRSHRTMHYSKNKQGKQLGKRTGYRTKRRTKRKKKEAVA